MPAKNLVHIQSWLTPAEKAEVTGLAARAGLTVSALVRRLVLGHRLPETGRAEAVRGLCKVNADLARLGNLLKMAMDDADFPQPRNPDLEPERLLGRIDATRTLLKTKIKEL